MHVPRSSLAFRPSTSAPAAPVASAVSAPLTKGAQTRDRILDAAQAIASRAGLEGLTIGGIAEQLGMSKSGVFAHFGSREDLQIAVIDDYARRFAQAVFRPALSLPRGLPRLTAMFENWLDRVQFVNIPNGCILVSGAIEFDDKEGPVRDRMVTVIRTWQSELHTAAAQANAEGHLIQACEPEQLVFELYGVILALHHDARLLRDARAVRRARSAYIRIIGHYARPGVQGRDGRFDGWIGAGLAA